MLYPALDVHDLESDSLLVIVDECSPTAVEEHDAVVTIFFSSQDARDRAHDAVRRSHPEVVATRREVDDEDWARRSQANLQPISIGALTIYPDTDFSRSARSAANAAHPAAQTPNELSLVIRPSMGFGTGHHVTTRLCLTAMQTIDLRGAIILDVGTGSGILALAGCLLGAAAALGIDSDEDAIHSAQENLGLNPGLTNVRFEVGDLSAMLSESLVEPASLVVANLTGALLIRAAGLLAGAARPGGRVIVSGLLQSEEPAVRETLESLGEIVWSAREDEWSALMLKKR